MGERARITRSCTARVRPTWDNVSLLQLIERQIRSPNVLGGERKLLANPGSTDRPAEIGWNGGRRRDRVAVLDQTLGLMSIKVDKARVQVAHICENRAGRG